MQTCFRDNKSSLSMQQVMTLLFENLQYLFIQCLIFQFSPVRQAEGLFLQLVGSRSQKKNPEAGRKGKNLRCKHFIQYFLTRYGHFFQKDPCGYDRICPPEFSSFKIVSFDIYIIYKYMKIRKLNFSDQNGRIFTNNVF